MFSSLCVIPLKKKELTYFWHVSVHVDYVIMPM